MRNIIRLSLFMAGLLLSTSSYACPAGTWPIVVNNASDYFLFGAVGSGGYAEHTTLARCLPYGTKYQVVLCQDDDFGHKEHCSYAAEMLMPFTAPEFPTVPCEYAVTYPPKVDNMKLYWLTVIQPASSLGCPQLTAG